MQQTFSKSSQRETGLKLHLKKLSQGQDINIVCFSDCRFCPLSCEFAMFTVIGAILAFPSHDYLFIIEGIMPD